MKEVIKIFIDATKELEWLAQQKGWKLVHTNGFRFIFDESECDYNYEYIYFQKNANELVEIRKHIKDSDIEFVCNSSTWALFRKETSKGELHVLEDNYINYKTLQRKYSSYLALGACYMGLATTQIALSFRFHEIYIVLSVLFCFCSIVFFLNAYNYKKSAQMYDDGTYAQKLKKDK